MIPKNDLIELYHIRGLSQRQVADELDVSRDTVRYWMKKHRINSRNKSEALRQWFLHQPVPFRTNPEGHEVWHDQTGQHEWDKTAHVLHHRLLAVAMGEDVVGKVVHHKNGIPWDNRPSNLEVMDAGEHTSLHESVRRGDCELLSG